MWLWPRDLYLFDEGMVLYEARRLREGAVLYRDVFQIVTPAFLYLVAAAFALFGTSMTVARGLMAVIHVGIQCMIYLVARRLGARPVLALLAAVAELAVAYSAMPQANPHWLSTLGGLVILLALLRADTPRAAFWFGVGCGFCLLVQQHRGIGLVVGVTAVQLVDAWAGASSWSAFGRQAISRLSRFGLGIVGMVAIGLGPLLVAAGPPALYEALVRFPLINYRHHHQGMVWWGLAFPPFTKIASVVRWIPLLIPLALIRVGIQCWQRQPPAA
ncbi:MAG TPA: hypothetical protein VL049_00995, partial [Candidatus Dormibacteraeota bacterium]|nr:hypothetical protein [Candidatus Dormibacteraeota bacterium]